MRNEKNYALNSAISKTVNYHAILRVNTRNYAIWKFNEKIIRFDSNLDREIYINFFRVNWCKNGIKWRTNGPKWYKWS